MKENRSEVIREMVRDQYAKVATSSGCGCGSSSCCGGGGATVSVDDLAQIMGYSKDQISAVVDGANLGLGCGNPTAIGKLKPGETVLDLGSGAGFDCFVAARQVGEQGRVIGVDMTPEMLSKARGNTLKMGLNNVEFRLGEIEHLPVADSVVDAIFSNCVINLSPEKKRVFRETYRVLKPGGRLALSDVVATDRMPEEFREQAALLTGCIAGAEHVDRIRQMLEEVGFVGIRIEIKPNSKELIGNWFPGSGVEAYVASADIEAIKPL